MTNWRISSSLFDEFFVRFSAKFFQNCKEFENLAYEKIVEFVDLVKSFPTSIWSQNSASIQPRTSLFKFGENEAIIQSTAYPSYYTSTEPEFLAGAYTEEAAFHNKLE